MAGPFLRDPPAASDAIEKPRWRGRLHQWASVYALGAGTGLVLLARDARGRAAAAVYALSLAVLFGVSATYHRITWRPRARAWFRRADHASIYLLIAGTYTPVALLGVGGRGGTHLLAAVWIGAAIGIVVSLFWPAAPKPVSAAIAIAVGWMVVPYWSAVRHALSTGQITLLLLGGVAYTVGALVYATRRPRIAPRVFGYHELFHAFTLVGALAHLVVVAGIMRAA